MWIKTLIITDRNQQEISDEQMETNSLFLESEDDLFEISSASSIGENTAIKKIFTLYNG